MYSTTTKELHRMKYAIDIQKLVNGKWVYFGTAQAHSEEEALIKLRKHYPALTLRAAGMKTACITE